MNRRFLSLLLLTALALSLLSGCGGSGSPTVTAEEFCKGMQSFDMAAMQKCIAGDAESIAEDLTFDDPTVQRFVDYMKLSAARMTYSLGEAEISGDSATVPVTFNYLDASGILSEAMSDVMGEALNKTLSGEELTEEEITNLLSDAFQRKQEILEAAAATETVELPLVREGGAWKLREVPDEVLNILTSNIFGALGELG